MTSETSRRRVTAPSSRRAARLCTTPVRGGGAHRWALFGRIQAGGGGRRTAREYAGAAGVSACDRLWRPRGGAERYSKRHRARWASFSAHPPTDAQRTARRFGGSARRRSRRRTTGCWRRKIARRRRAREARSRLRSRRANWPTLRQAQALQKRAHIATTKRPCARAIIAPRCSAVRCAGPRSPRSPMGAVRGDSRRRPRLPHGGEYAAVGVLETHSLRSPTVLHGAPCGLSARRGGAYTINQR